MVWENAYCFSRTIDDVRQDYLDIKKMMSSYDEKIVGIDKKISKLKENFGSGSAQQITALEDMRGNLLYAYKGLCANERALREKLERMEKGDKK
jgi:hypothetical protein